MNLIEKIQKAKELNKKLRNSLAHWSDILEGYEKYLVGYKNTHELEEENLGDRYISNIVNILLSYVKMLNDVKAET